MYKPACSGVVYGLGDFIIQNALAVDLNPGFFCSQTLELCTESEYKLLPPEDYINRILADKPASIANDDFIDNLYAEIA